MWSKPEGWDRLLISASARAWPVSPMLRKPYRWRPMAAGRRDLPIRHALAAKLLGERRDFRPGFGVGPPAAPFAGLGLFAVASGLELGDQARLFIFSERARDLPHHPLAG